MSKLEALIHQLCPDGVKHTKLQNVCIFQNGFVFKSSLFKEQGEPILRIANISDGEIDEDSEYVFFDPDDYKEDLDKYKVFKGDIVVAMSGATTGKIGYNYSDKTYYLNQRVGMFVVNEKMMVKRYLYHWLCMQSSNILNAASGSGAQPNLSSTKMMEFLIPLPPLEVQQEIVRILDQFTELTAELTAELTTRKKQYEYYLNNLLCKQNSAVHTIKLEEVCDFFNGDRGKNYPTQNDYVTVGIPFVNAGDLENGSVSIEKCRKITPEKFYSMGGAKLQKGDILYCLRGSVGKNGIFDDDQGALASSLVAIRPHSNVCPKYIYYLLNSQLEEKQRICKDNGAAQPNLSAQSVKAYRFPLPSFSEQHRIVSILDHFDALCNDLTSGLPAEIEARRKQYEYYRDKLLTFKELEA